MEALIIILAIIAFFVILLSVKLSVIVHYDEDITLSVRWLFIKIQLLPADKNKKKKQKKEKKKKKENPEEKKDETVAPPKEKKENLFVRFYHNRGVSGVIELLRNTVSALKGMFGRILRAFIIDDLFISLIVGASDAAQTAIKHGKVCSVVYPLLGFISTHMRVHKQKCEVIPDFVQGQNIARLHAQISVVPRRMINATIIVAFQLLFKVLIKLLRGGSAKKPAQTEQIMNKSNINSVKGGN